MRGGGRPRNGCQYAHTLHRNLNDELGRFQQARQEFFACKPSWRRVRGGRAAHAFFADDQIPVCGITPMRGDPLVPSRWTDANGAHWVFRRQHGECVRLAKAKSTALMEVMFTHQRELARAHREQMERDVDAAMREAAGAVYREAVAPELEALGLDSTQYTLGWEATDVAATD